MEELNYVELKTMKLPVYCNINALEAIQNKYGSYEEWGSKFADKSKNKVDMTTFKWTVALFVNEGIKYKRLTDPGYKQTNMTEEDIGTLISLKKMEETITIIMKAFTKSARDEDEEEDPNVKSPAT